MKFNMTDAYDDVMNRLFTFDSEGSVTIGTARSCDHVTKLACLDDWTLFSDYVMEGFVTYQLRLLKQNAGTILELRLAGTNRDKYIPFAIQQCLKMAGLQWREGD